MKIQIDILTCLLSGSNKSSDPPQISFILQDKISIGFGEIHSV